MSELSQINPFFSIKKTHPFAIQPYVLPPDHNSGGQTSDHEPLIGFTISTSIQ